jgi:signal transduction histidine kinase
MMALTMGSRARTAELADTERHALVKRARRRANHRIAFLAHLVVYGGVLLLLLVAASFLVMTVVGISWGIGVAIHGFFAVMAPELRERWVADEVSRTVESSVVSARRTLGAEHARAMHQLSASVAHEIRNPITAAKSLVQQMGEDPRAEENVEFARVAIEELDRVERSIARLLRYAREEELTMAAMRLNPVIQSAVESFRDRLAGVDLRCTLVDSDELCGDAEALRRVIINLLGNALDAVEERAPAVPCIEIATGHDLAHRELWLRVADNGGGIAADDADAVFDLFHTSKEGGTGLGLAITKKLVEAHGGNIEVTPGRAEGTEIVVTLPLEEGATS